MAISVLSTPDGICPAYSKQEYVLYDASLVNTAGLYYQLDISIGGQTRYIKQLPDANKQAKIDVQSIVQSFFESIVLTHDEFLLDFSTGLSNYSCVAHSKVDSLGVDSSVLIDPYVDSVNFYVFNGVNQYNRQWDPSSFLFMPGSNAGFLTNWEAARDIHIDDPVYFQFFVGVLKNPEYYSFIEGMTITKYSVDGSVSSVDVSISLGDDPAIYSCNVGPSSINLQLSTEFIDSSTSYYTVTLIPTPVFLEETPLSKTYRINIQPIDQRYKKYYRVYYVNSYGATEAFNFDFTTVNSIDIKKTVYRSNRIMRSFAPSIVDNYQLTSDWVYDEVSKALKELWPSPKVMLYEPDEELLIPVILTESNKTILNKRNQQLYNYTVNFTKAEEYLIQQF